MLDLKRSDWGGSVVFGGRSISYRQIVTAVGVTLWLAIMLIRTGKGGVASIATTVQFVLTLLVLSAATRSLRWQSLLAMFLAGGFMMGITVAVGKILGLTAGTLATNAAVAIVEEAAVLAPPLWLLWRWRNGRIWGLGATDIFLLFAFCGAGFGMVETAYILNARSIDQFSWLPVVAIDGDRIRGFHIFNGHEVWAGVAGIAAGLAWMLRSKGSWVWFIAVAGIALGTIDHFALDARRGGLIVDILATLTGNGYMVLLAFIAGALAAIALDANIIYRQMPEGLWTLVPKSGSTAKRLGSLLDLRAVAYANYQADRANDADKEKAAELCLAVTERM